VLLQPSPSFFRLLKRGIQREKEREMGGLEVSWKLADHPKLAKGKTVAVVVLDGWGEADPDPYNCIHVADTPTMDSLKQVYSI